MTMASARSAARTSSDPNIRDDPGIAQGGIVAAILDEVVGRVALIGDPNHFMMTVRMELTYRGGGVDSGIRGATPRLRPSARSSTAAHSAACRRKTYPPAIAPSVAGR
jgi:hypothetical protein